MMYFVVIPMLILWYIVYEHLFNVVNLYDILTYRLAGRFFILFAHVTI